MHEKTSLADLDWCLLRVEGKFFSCCTMYSLLDNLTSLELRFTCSIQSGCRGSRENHPACYRYFINNDQKTILLVGSVVETDEMPEQVLPQQNQNEPAVDFVQNSTEVELLL